MLIYLMQTAHSRLLLPRTGRLDNISQQPINRCLHPGFQCLGQRGFYLTGSYRWALFSKGPYRGRLQASRFVVGETGTRRYQSTDHHVFLQPAQEVALAGNCRFGQYPRGFLERSCRDKRLRSQRSFGDTQQLTLVLCFDLVGRTQLVVLFQHLGNGHLLTANQSRITWLSNLHFAQHLTDNHLNVLVVDTYTLQTIYLLHFVDDVLGQSRNTLQTQDVVWRGRTVRNHFTFLNELTFEYRHGTPFRDQRLIMTAAILHYLTLFRGDDQATLAFGLAAEADGSRNLSQNGRLFRFASLKQIRNARQTTGNVPRLRAFLRDAGDNITHAQLLSITCSHDGVGWQEVHRRRIGARDTQLLTFPIQQSHRRSQLAGCARTLCRLNDSQAGQPCHFVGSASYGQTFFHIGESYLPCHLGNNRMSVRVPGCHNLPGLNLAISTQSNDGTVRQLVLLALTTGFVVHNQLA